MYHNMHSYIMTKNSEELQDYNQHKLIHNAFSKLILVDGNMAFGACVHQRFYICSMKVYYYMYWNIYLKKYLNHHNYIFYALVLTNWYQNVKSSLIDDVHNPHLQWVFHILQQWKALRNLTLWFILRYIYIQKTVNMFWIA